MQEETKQEFKERAQEVTVLMATTVKGDQSLENAARPAGMTASALRNLTRGDAIAPLDTLFRMLHAIGGNDAVERVDTAIFEEVQRAKKAAAKAAAKKSA